MEVAPRPERLGRVSANGEEEERYSRHEAWIVAEVQRW